MDVLGIDLDNTLIRYDAVWPAGLEALGIRVPASLTDKRPLRDWLRQQPDGEQWWQRLQAYAYGPGLSRAELAPGAGAFLAEAAKAGVPIYIVSHKTAHAAADPDGVNLREAARQWLVKAGVTGPAGIVPDDRVFFEATREEKIARMVRLGCTHFVDDLVETFSDPTFPETVDQLLYAPDGAEGCSGPWRVYTAWSDIAVYFEERWGAAEDALIAAAFSRLGRPLAGYSAIGAGRNSRVYRVELRDGSRLALKRYQGEDATQRRETEYAAFTLLHELGVREVPMPVVTETAGQFSIVSFESGEDPNVAPIASDVDACAAFVRRLVSIAPEVNWKAPAKEAASSLETVRGDILRRRESLEAASHEGPLAEDFRAFLHERFDPALDRFTEQAERYLHTRGLALDHVPAGETRILSPSDFGLHNAIRRTDGTLCFVDFEYFGRDDLIKLTCDFLLHPGMNVTEDLRRRFLDQIRPAARDHTFSERLPVAYVLFGLKWCMILLNEFLPRHRARRRFAGEERDDAAVCRDQLGRARTMLDKVVPQDGGFPDL